MKDGLETLGDAARGALPGTIRHDWTVDAVLALMRQPFPELIYTAQSVHRRHFDPAKVELAQLLSIKTGGCPEDCGYCSQSAHFETGVKATKLMAADEIVAEARRAKANGATRFCMGAAWRSPKDRDIDALCPAIEAVKDLGLETCVTLGMLTGPQAHRLKAAGLDFYNHNLDTSPEHYAEIVSTRTYADRLATLEHVRDAGIAVCCGGIVGLGESEHDRAALLSQLANLPVHPESVPINMLMRVEGTPLGQSQRIDVLDLVRTIAAARIVLPQSVVRLSAGREGMSE
jgi:biotin synthase